MSRFADTVLDKMRQEGWTTMMSADADDASDEERPAAPARQIKQRANADASLAAPAGVEAGTAGPGWAMWQKVIDATSSGVIGVASAVKKQVNSDEGLCGTSSEVCLDDVQC